MWESRIAPFARKHLRCHVADKLIYIDIPREYGFDRRWFSHVWLDGEELVFPVLAQSFLTTTPGSNQTYTSDPTWNNANNTIECLGGGATGGASVGAGWASGGGAGAYSKITNFTFATPGTTTATYNIGKGGTANTVSTVSTIANGVAGTVTYFNASADPGNGADNTKVSAAPGSAGAAVTTGTATGGAGGLTTAGWGQTKTAGGNGANATLATTPGGAGGAAGPFGNGANGISTSGGGADAGHGGTGGTSGANGGNGTEWDASHGSGGGGGSKTTSAAGTATAGAGGLYGGGSGGATNTHNLTGDAATSPAASQGIIVLTWTLSPAFRLPLKVYLRR